MSTPRLRLAGAEFKVGASDARPIAAHQYRCGECNRAAMIETNGLLLVRARHDGDAHATAYNVADLTCDLISRMSPSQVKKVEQAVTLRVAALSMGSARTNSEPDTRLA
jgi:hypothetical protein